MLRLGLTRHEDQSIAPLGAPLVTADYMVTVCHIDSVTQSIA